MEMLPEQYKHLDNLKCIFKRFFIDLQSGQGVHFAEVYFIFILFFWFSILSEPVNGCI